MLDHASIEYTPAVLSLRHEKAGAFEAVVQSCTTESLAALPPSLPASRRPDPVYFYFFSGLTVPNL